jgi:hypothetical protein
LFNALLQPPADLVEQSILLPVDLSTGLVIGPPGVLAFGFKSSRGALPLQLLRKGRCQTGGLLGLLERIVQLR